VKPEAVEEKRVPVSPVQHKSHTNYPETEPGTATRRTVLAVAQPTAYRSDWSCQEQNLTNITQKLHTNKPLSYVTRT